MAQERYFDYKSEIKSKKSAEQGLILNGVGPQYGFDKVTLDLANGTVTLDTNQPKTFLDLKDKYYDLYWGQDKKIKDLRFLNSESGAFKPVIGAVVTLDGILTLVDEPITIDLPEDFMTELNNHTNVNEVCNWCLCITAYHNYQPSASPFATIFRVAAWCMGSATSSSSSNFNRICTLQKSNFRNWFTNFSQLDVTNFYNQMNQPNEVFIGLYTFFTVNKEVIDKDTNLPSIMSSNKINPQSWMNRWCIPYKYRWDPNEVDTVLEKFGASISASDIESMLTSYSKPSLHCITKNTFLGDPSDSNPNDDKFYQEEGSVKYGIEIKRAKVIKHKGGFVEYEVFGSFFYYNFITNNTFNPENCIHSYTFENIGINLPLLTEKLGYYGGKNNYPYWVNKFDLKGNLNFNKGNHSFPFIWYLDETPDLHNNGFLEAKRSQGLIMSQISDRGFPLTPPNNHLAFSGTKANIRAHFHLIFRVVE